MARDTLEDVESGIDLRIMWIQKTFKDKKKYVSPFVALLKEKGLEEDAIDQRLKTRSFRCSWQISEHTLFLTSLFRSTEERFDNLFLSNPTSEALRDPRDKVELSVKASWFSGVIITSYRYAIDAKDKNGVAYYITEGNCTKKRVLHVKDYPFAKEYRYGRVLTDFLEYDDIDLSKVIQ